MNPLSAPRSLAECLDRFRRASTALAVALISTIGAANALPT